MTLWPWATPTCDVHDERVGVEGLAAPGGLAVHIQGLAQQRGGHPHALAVVPHHVPPVGLQHRALLWRHSHQPPAVPSSWADGCVSQGAGLGQGWVLGWGGHGAVPSAE